MKRLSENFIRKDFLLGASGACLVLPSLEANTEAAEVPKRMVFAATYLGFMPDHFFPKQSGNQYELTKLLEPLKNHRKDMTVLSGLDHNITGGHVATKFFLTGIKPSQSKSFKEANISVDQKAANFVGAKTRFPSLVLGCNSRMDNGVSWTRNGNQVQMIQSLDYLMSLLFTNPDANKIREEELSYKEKTSILDLVRNQAKNFEKKLGKNDVDKLDQYYTSVRSLEKKIHQSNLWLHKEKPQVNYRIQSGVDSLVLTSKVPVFYDLITLALLTDSTRVVSLSFNYLGHNSGGLPGVNHDYHALSHHGKVQKSIDELLIIEKFFTSQFARFISKLKELKEPNGKTLLDNTMALLGSGMSNANSHSNKNLPILLAGGGYRHGHHLNLAKSSSESRPLCDLFLNMLQNFGMNIDQFNLSKSNLSELKRV